MGFNLLSLTILTGLLGTVQGNPAKMVLTCSSAVRSISQSPYPPFDLGIQSVRLENGRPVGTLVVMDPQRTKFQRVRINVGKAINIYGVNYLVAEIKAGEWGTPDCGITLKRSGFIAPKK